MNINSILIKKITGLVKDVTKVVVVEGTISLISQGLREVSHTNYKKTKEGTKQIYNLTRNQIDGREPSDWDLI